MKEIYKEYDRAFLLESTKLTRLIEIIHERLADQHQTTLHDSFEIYLSGSHREDMSKVVEVLALDNSRKRKIERLVIVCSATAAGAVNPDREVQVDFASPKVVTASGNTGTKTVVAITVRSDNGAWASSTLSEVEEQVERTWLHYGQHILGLLAISVFLFIILSAQLASMVPQRQNSVSTMWLQGSDLDRVEAFVRDQRIITDEEHREIVTRQLRNVLEAERPRESPAKSGTRQYWYVMIPLIGVLGCMIFLIATSYPKAVFAWGDGADRYSAMLQRRKILWGVIVGILCIGLLSKLLYEGLIPWFPRE